MSTQKPHLETPSDGTPLRSLPSVNELVESADLALWSKMLPRELIVSAARQVISRCRQDIMHGAGAAIPTLEHFVGCVDSHLKQAREFALPQVINATGILLHTGLGRAPLSANAVSAIALACLGYTPLEMELHSGERGHRVDVVRRQLSDFAGAESATVVNNNAAALLITLNTLAVGKRGDCFARRID